MDASRAGDTRHPAYPWAMGASLGLAAVGAYYLAYYFAGWPWDLRAAFALWLAFLGGYPFLHDGAGVVGVFVGAVARGWVAADDDQPGDEGAPGPGEPTRTVSPLVGGGLLDSWEQYHHDGLLLFLDHAEAANALTSTALIPAAFTDGKHWGYWAGVLAASQLCVKSNGVATTLPAGRTWAWAKRQVRNGLFETPEDLGAPPPALPHPFRLGLEYKHNAEKAGKGGLNVGKVAGGYDDDE